MGTIPDLTLIDCEQYAIARIPRNWRLPESALQTRAWFDYRPMHPVQRTLHFAKSYNATGKDFVKRYVDIDMAEAVNPVKNLNVFESMDALVFWCARQKLDKFGLPYVFALSEASLWAARMGFRYYPRPNQFLTEEFLVDTLARWQERVRGAVVLPTHPHFLAANFAAQPDQKAFQAWLAEMVRRHPDKLRFLATLIRRGFVLRDEAPNTYGALLYREALSIANSSQ
ncbi:hypothetical protein [Cupriavidus metallidurans]|uniref:hypothetical protein n=1 Tax=Cupriavidus metallidurans TaxID=119219 RepID=UPI001CD0018A|nr:hypothetical protein [Cupriavidus metallidurans]UBM12740.1 hypothetical protein LAI70_28415 [Cupriavidus metallidurans]